MDKPNRIRQVYGYTVCLVAVVTTLICLNGVVRNAIDLSDPLAAASEYGDNLGSFEAWMATRSRYSPEAKADTASAATLKERFVALQVSAVAQRRFRARKELIAQLIVLGVAMALFVTHWKWLRRTRDDEPTAV